MFAITASVRVRPGRREDFLETIAHQADTSIKLEPGCLRFEIWSRPGMWCMGDAASASVGLFLAGCF